MNAQNEILNLIADVAVRLQAVSPQEGWLTSLMIRLQRIEENSSIQSTKFDAVAFGNALNIARDNAGLSLRELEKEIGVSASTLSRFESGNMPDLLSYAKVCKWLGEDMHTFFISA